MFNINSKIAREKLRRDAAIEQMKHTCHQIADDATAPADAFEEAVRKQPLGACAISLGAGLAVSSLMPSRTVVTHAPQKVIVDLRNGTTETPKPAPQSNVLDMVMQALNLMGVLKPPAPPPMPPDPPRTNGNDGMTANL